MYKYVLKILWWSESIFTVCQKKEKLSVNNALILIFERKLQGYFWYLKELFYLAF